MFFYLFPFYYFLVKIFQQEENEILTFFFTLQKTKTNNEVFCFNEKDKFKKKTFLKHQCDDASIYL